MDATRTRWNPPEILTNIDNSSCNFTCVGYAPSKNRRCYNPIAAANRHEASKLLTQMAKLEVSSIMICSLLEQLAPRLLCQRYHQNQSWSMIKQWQDDIEDLREEESAREAESARLEREAAQRVEDARRERAAARRAEDARLEREAAQRVEDARRERAAARRAEDARLEREAAQRVEDASREEEASRQREASRRQQEAIITAIVTNDALPSNANRPVQATSSDSNPRTPSNDRIETPSRGTPQEPLSEIEQLRAIMASLTTRVEALEAQQQALGHHIHEEVISQAEDQVTTPASPTSEPDASVEEPPESQRLQVIEGDCSICLESLGSEHGVTRCRAVCGQPFHLNCIGIWLASDVHTHTCPYCRANWIN